MSKYTTEVRYICESKSGFEITQISSKSVDEIINASWDQIFDFPMNFYNAAWNEKIAKFILKYYYTREIGLETVGLWKLKLNARCAEISGKYEPLIEALEELTVDDFLYNYRFTGNNDRTDNLTDLRTDDLEKERTDDLTNTLTDNLTDQRTDNLTNLRTDDLTNQRTDNLTSTTTNDLTSTRTDNLQKQTTDSSQSQRTDNLTSTRDQESKDKFSDTPQNGLTSVENGSYLTNYRNIENDETVHDTGTQTTNNSGSKTEADTGTVTVKDTGTSNIKDTGTQTSAQTGTQTTVQTGTQTHLKTGTQTTAQTGTQTETETGTQTISHTGTQKTAYGETGYKGAATIADAISKIEFERFNILGQIALEFSDLFMLIW